jgi:hypothetical protein
VIYYYGMIYVSKSEELRVNSYLRNKIDEGLRLEQTFTLKQRNGNENDVDGEGQIEDHIS